jgi:hypothetical protein
MKLLTPFLKAPSNALPVVDLVREPPALTRPTGLPIWNLLANGFGNPYLRVPQQQNLRLYEQMVETIPICDAALDRMVELVGCPYIEAEPETQKEVQDWLDNLSVNRTQTGFDNAVNTWLKAHLLYGRAHMEIILTANRREIYALQCLHTRTIDLRPAADGYSTEMVQLQASSGQPRLLNPRLVLTGCYDVRDDSPQGNSLLFGLPFVAEIVASMMKDVKDLWERFGNPSYHIRWKPDSQFADPTSSKSTSYLSTIMARWNQAMKQRAEGDVTDFATAGDIEVTVIGANGEELEFAVPFRTFAEQMVAKFGLPPMMLGLQWQAGERIGAHQAALLKTRVERIRRGVEAEILYLIRLRQQLAGKDDQVTLKWKAPTLIDASETARARLLDAQAQKLELDNLDTIWRHGACDNIYYVRKVRPDLENRTDEQLPVDLPELVTEPPALPAPQPFGGGGSGQQGGNSNLQSLTYGTRPVAKNGNGKR